MAPSHASSDGGHGSLELCSGKVARRPLSAKVGEVGICTHPVHDLELGKACSNVWTEWGL